MARQNLNTNRELMLLARSIHLMPAPNKAVFYHDDVGEKRSILYTRQHPGSTRIDELLARSPKGNELLSKLKNISWSEKEEVWWELSRKLARSASGDVHCFGPERLSRNQPIKTHESRYVRGSYCHTVFEKIELPELENNIRVDSIYYNGKII